MTNVQFASTIFAWVLLEAAFLSTMGIDFAAFTSAIV